MPAETPMHPTKLNFDSILLPTASTRVRNHAHSATADTRVWDHERDNATSTPPPPSVAVGGRGDTPANLTGCACSRCRSRRGGAA